ncbi:MAG: SIS domain-containing protein [Anaerolineae bacterium]|nr:SIS domain-containing protein [Anaerolineae bacterium]
MVDSHLSREIREQPAVLQTVLEREMEAVSSLAERLRQRAPRYVVLAARGSSDNAARYGQYLLGAFNGITAALATPSLYTLYRRPPSLKDALVIGVSQSGQSPDIVSVIAEGRSQGALTVAITNDTHSPLAQAAQTTLDLCAGPEYSLAATKTYTSSLMVLAMLSAAWAGDAERLVALQQTPQWAAAILEDLPHVLQIAERYRYMEACVVTGRGFNYATAFEVALKLKELTYIMAEPYSSADFQHGPVAIVEQGFPVLAVLPEGAAAQDMLTFLRSLQAREPELLVISPLAEALALAQTPLPLPVSIPEWLSPLLAVIPGQMFALGLTLARGYDPDHPRGLRKVTLTR